jgi:hypothetical protein
VVKSADRANKRATGSTFSQALREPMQVWLDERLEYMGFEPRAFPSLTPLDDAMQQRAAGATINSSSSSSSSSDGMSSNSGSSSDEQQLSAPECTSRTFARWLQQLGGNSGLPLLASQWHDVHRWAAAGGRGPLVLFPVQLMPVMEVPAPHDVCA